MEDAIEITPRGLALRVSLCLRGGLHARPAARLAQEAQRYSSAIQLISETGAADAKSMLDILSLAPPADAELTLLADGEDAREALCGLARFLTTLQE
ncbi:HPr family phosphocarrier protein [Desulfovibrio sp. ZJ200]|uniref:HPr family phosphocarrier protein n=1 Tax=Desulfovibrio sp. ZJ200 TaxID=2709792 RepID=UPI0013ED32BA|nr:HPr family phosphocarrier protein [Desulfovibrio sp. ZJ200]